MGRADKARQWLHLVSVKDLVNELEVRGDFVVFWLDEIHPDCDRGLLRGARMEVPGWRHDFRAEVVRGE